MTTCPYCAIVAPRGARRCPACGTQLIVRPWMMVAAALCVAAVLAVGLYASGKIKKRVAWNRVTDADAFTAVSTYLQKHESVPHPARIADRSDSIVERWDARRWRISGFVEAKEKSGAPVRMRYICVVSYAGPDHWSLEDLHLEKIE